MWSLRQTRPYMWPWHRTWCVSSPNHWSCLWPVSAWFLGIWAWQRMQGMEKLFYMPIVILYYKSLKPLCFKLLLQIFTVWSKINVFLTVHHSIDFFQLRT
jgi:hypothetical protein